MTLQKGAYLYFHSKYLKGGDGMNQSVIDQAVKIATKAAMNGHPVERIIWIPPAQATSDPLGAFAIVQCSPLSASDTAPWDK